MDIINVSTFLIVGINVYLLICCHFLLLGTMDIINMLPELRERIFNYLVHSDILQFACSCKDAYNLTKYLLFHTVSISADCGNTSAFDGILKNIEFVKNV